MSQRTTAIKGVRTKTLDAISNMAFNLDSDDYTFLLIEFKRMGLVNADGSPSDPKDGACIEASLELEEIYLMGIANVIPRLSEGTQLEISAESDVIKSEVELKKELEFIKSKMTKEQIRAVEKKVAESR